MSNKPHPSPPKGIKAKTKKPTASKKLSIVEQQDDNGEFPLDDYELRYRPHVEMMGLNPSWDELVADKRQRWVSFHALAHALFNHPTMQMGGWSRQHDPLYKHPERLGFPSYQVMDEQDDDDSPYRLEELGALELDGMVLMFFWDPDDGYRSHAGSVLVWPGQQLATRLPDVPVRFVAANSDHWDDPSINQRGTPSLLDVLAIDIGQSVATVGTSHGDSYYPSAIFRLDAAVMDQAAIPLAQRRQLIKEVEPEKIKKGRGRKI